MGRTMVSSNLEERSKGIKRWKVSNPKRGPLPFPTGGMEVKLRSTNWIR